MLLSGYPTAGPVPQDVVGWLPIYLAKTLSALGLGAALLWLWRKCEWADDSLVLLRLALVPIGAYLLLTTTVHPWYVTWLLPLAAFLLPGPDKDASPACPRRFLVPLLYWSAVVPLSYLAYLDPAKPREIGLVRLLEYVPLYALLIWAATGCRRRAAGHVPA